VHPDQGQTLLLYAGAVGALVLMTAIYTTFGGIKAVVWTDLLQVFLMFGAMFYATWSLWHSVGGWNAIVTETHRVVLDPAVVKSAGEAAARAQAEEVTQHSLAFWDWGTVAGLGFWGNVKHVLETEYTVFSAFLASVFVTMATHGTDQDMVQRMLTAPDIRRSRRSLILSGLADIPVALSFTFIGVLLWVYYQLPANAARRPETDYFVNFILRELPVGVRGIMAAGLFATAMGSLSTALNALATSFTRDFYLGLVRKTAGQREQMVAARWATAGFAVLLAAIGVGTAWVKLTHPQVRIIPIVLGSFGYTYGSLLGIFLVGMTTRTRGNCTGNLLAMLTGFAVVAFFSNLPNDFAKMFGTTLYQPPDWLPIIEFPWRIAFGTVVTFGVALCFRTPEKSLTRLRDDFATNA
jgi:Na+/proline symporter